MVPQNKEMNRSTDKVYQIYTEKEDMTQKLNQRGQYLDIHCTVLSTFLQA
jgi:hypothetical protein